MWCGARRRAAWFEASCVRGVSSGYVSQILKYDGKVTQAMVEINVPVSVV